MGEEAERRRRLVSNARRKPRYGFYGANVYMLSLTFFLFLGVGIVIVGVVAKAQGLKIVGLCLLLYGVISTLGWLLGRYVIPGGPVRFAQDIIASLGISGKEVVLDVGTGRGLYAVEIAKKITTGQVVAIDLWEYHDSEEKNSHHKWAQPTGNTIENARTNARLEGVDGKITFLNMDACRLRFPCNTFDVVVCAYLIGHLGELGKQVLSETNRVLKPEGRLFIVDNVIDFTFLLMSTPHLFAFSYLRGKKAMRLTRGYWLDLLKETGYRLKGMKKGRGIILLESTPTTT